jgi:hypothetical protein
MKKIYQSSLPHFMAARVPGHYIFMRLNYAHTKYLVLI